MPASEKIVADIARRLRDGILLAQKRDGGSDAWLKQFPRNCCNRAANYLVVALNGIGQTIRREIGTVSGEKHVWVRVDGLYVDITADQLGGPEVVASAKSQWHEKISNAKPFIDDRDGLAGGLQPEEIQRLLEFHRAKVDAFMDS